MSNPNVYGKFEVYNESFANIPYDSLFTLYADTILLNACTSDVERAMVGYVTSVVEPVGWKAIWKHSKNSSRFVVPVQEMTFPSDCDFLVEVQDVSLIKLQATISVLEALYDTQKLEDHIDGSSDLDITLRESGDVDVPLVQLFPLKDEDGLFQQTANTIETVRFFYSNIWRPWDDDDDDSIFVEKHLSSRLKFYFEQQSGSLPEMVECRIRERLSEAMEIRSHLNSLQSQMNLSNSDGELEENDVHECIKLRYRMDVLQREFETQENPLLRNFAIKDLHHRNNHKNAPTTHLVADKVTFGMIKSLHLTDETLLEIHDSLEQAMAASTSEDTIIIFPGTYKTGPLPWLEQNLSIKGVPGNEKVILQASEGCGELFLSCSTQSLLLCDLELIPSSSMMSCIMVHEGSLTMNDCVIRGAKHCLVILAEGKASFTNCTFCYSWEDAIQLRVGANLKLDGCSIHDCHGNGLSLDSPLKPSSLQTTLSINATQINENGKYGLMATCPRDTILPQDNLCWEELKSLPWVDLTVESVECTENKSGDLGFCYQDPPKNVSVPSPPEDYKDFLNSVYYKPQYDEC